MSSPFEPPPTLTGKPDFVSVVGVSRSGTSLMRRILNTSSEVAIADENNYLGHLLRSEGARYKFRQFGDLSEEASARRLVDYIYSFGLRDESKYKNYNYWRWLIQHVNEGDLVQRVTEAGRDERALFEALLRPYADQQGKSIIGEKSPNHYFYVDTLLDWFPQGKIVHMMRDPRGNFVSELKRRRARANHTLPTPYRQLQKADPLLKVFIAAVVTYTWRQSARQALRHRQQNPKRYHVLHFERLISEPEDQIRQLCDFLAIRFEPEMLRQGVARGWFNNGKAGFDEEAISRWKGLIDGWADRWFQAVLGKFMARLGYA